MCFAPFSRRYGRRPGDCDARFGDEPRRSRQTAIADVQQPVQELHGMPHACLAYRGTPSVLPLVHDTTLNEYPLPVCPLRHVRVLARGMHKLNGSVFALSLFLFLVSLWRAMYYM